MAYKHTGPVAGAEVGINDPKSFLLAAPGAASVATFSSTEGGVEFVLAAVAGGTAFAVRSGALADRFPMGKDLTVTVTGDASTFLRVDG